MSNILGILLESVITCPECGFSRQETMPIDACLFYWECPSCRVTVRPKGGDCCVYCSFATVPCPPVQQSRRNGCCQS